MSMPLPATYFPLHTENRMENEGNVAAARASYFSSHPRNLRFLLQTRYDWMNSYLQDKTAVVELGAGSGFSREFISNRNLLLTDVENNPWIDEQVDALALPYSHNSVDALICVNVIHHFANPKRFLRGVERVLKPGGVLLIFDPHPSFFLKLILRVMRQEGWSYRCDPFDDQCVANDPRDPWSGNNALSHLLFHDASKFEAAFPSLVIERRTFAEFLLFPLSGGVTSRTKTIQLPEFMLRLIHLLDGLLVRLAPSIFALGVQIVLRKRNNLR